jgi:plastocyanin
MPELPTWRRFALHAALALAGATGCTADNPDFGKDAGAVGADFSTAVDGMDRVDLSGADLLPPRDLAVMDMTVPPTTYFVKVGSGGRNFSPSRITIRARDIVEWQWSTSGHNVVSGINGVPDSWFCSPNDSNCWQAPLSGSGTIYRHTFSTAGAYPYFCSTHWPNGMTGVVTVQ